MSDALIAEPSYFGAAGTPLLGWLHRPAPGRGLGVVLCPPLGHELVHTHRSLWALAQAIAGRGLPVLRLDYAGTGDSADLSGSAAGGESSTGAVAAWQASIEAAIGHLQARTGVRRVALLAVRSGTLLAAAVAARHADVAALVALAPVVSGRRLLREWRALAAQAALQAVRDDGALEVAGFTFDRTTCAVLEALDLEALALPAALAVRVIDREDLPAADRWRSRLEEAGLAVTHDRHPGLAGMLEEPQRHVVPQAAVQACAEWVDALAARLDPGAGTLPGRLPADPGPTVSAQVDAAVRETVLRIVEPDPRDPAELRAILAEPAHPLAGADAPPVLLLLNTGPVHHIGGHRLYVRLARTLASRGCAVLRLDLTGLGDSPPRPGEPPGAIYGPRAVDDVALAAAWAHARWPGRDIILLGLCAGAYHALKTAVRGSPVARAVIVNPLVYDWRDGMTLESAEVALQAVYYRSKWRRLESWKRLVSGRSDVRMLAQVAGRGVKRLAGRMVARPQPGRVAPGPPDEALHDLGRELERATGHGIRLDFIYAQDEPGWPLLQQQAAATVRRLQAMGRLSVQHLPRADHSFSTDEARGRFIRCVEALLWPAAVAPPMAAQADLAEALVTLDMTRQGS